MEGLPVTVFDRFDWDGATAARMSRVCRAWYHNIRRVPRFVKYMDCHYVRVDAISELCQEAYFETRYLTLIHPAKATRKMEYLLSVQCNLNMYKIQGSIIDVLAEYGFYGEDIKYFYNKNNGDIIIMNNFYGNVDRISNSTLRLNILEQEIMHGTFSWKFIMFPFCSTSVELRPCAFFHRGASFCLKFKARGFRSIGPDITKHVVHLRKIGKRKRNREVLTETESKLFNERRKRNIGEPLDPL